MYPAMKASDMDRDTIHGSLSLAWRIGRAVRIARQRPEVYKMPQAILDSVQKCGKFLFQGKIVGVERKLFKGHVWVKFSSSHWISFIRSRSTQE